MFLSYKLRDHELRGSQFMVLLELVKKDGLSQEAINEGLLFDKGFLAKTAKSLEKEGYIIRKINQEDRRAYQLFLTDKAKSFIPMMFKILDEWDETLLQEVNKEEVNLLKDILNGMLERVAVKCKEVKGEL